MTEIDPLPFQPIKPIKFIGINQNTPFCSIITEGRLMYMAGTNIIMENTKTNQQKILWNNTFNGPIHLVHHHITLYNDHLLAISLRDTTTLMNLVIIVPLNNIIFNLEERKERYHTHYLKYIQDYEEIKQIHFFQEGSLFGVVSEYQKITTLAILRTSTGDVLFQQSYCQTKVQIENITVNKLSCISVLQHDLRGEVRLCLMAVEEITRRFYYNVPIGKDEKIIEYFFEPYQDESLMLALVSTGFVLILKINQFDLTLLAKVDVRLDKSQQHARLKRRISFDAGFIQNNGLPVSMQSATNKLILVYQQAPHLAILQYSSFNPKNTKFIIIHDALSKYSLIKGIKSIRVSKDNCNVACAFQIDPFKQTCDQDSTANLDDMNSNLQVVGQFNPYIDGEVTPPDSLTQSNLGYGFELSTTKNIQETSHIAAKQYMVVQIDILSNTIDHQDHTLSVQDTFSVYSGHAGVESIEYCPYNNTLFMLLQNKYIKYYNLSPKQTAKGPNNTILFSNFKIQGLLMWKHFLKDQPISIAVHPFTFTLLLIYQDIIKFHNYNSKKLLPAFLVTNIKNCKNATYSPLGDKLVLATNGAIIILNSYTYQLIRTVSLPNIITQLTGKAMGNKNGKKYNLPSGSKVINKMVFINNDDLLLYSGSSTFSLVLNNQRAVHFGFIDKQHKQKYQQIVYDDVNKLAIMSHYDHILVLAKSNINSYNRCELVSKIQIGAASLCLCAQLGVLFVGGQDGILYMLKWPDYSGSQTYLHHKNQTHLFHEPIVHVSVTANMKYLFTISRGGSMCISEIPVNSEQGLTKTIKDKLVKLSQLPLKISDRWLMSLSEQERKQRTIIKLRGEEADTINNHSIISKEKESTQEQLIEMKRLELQKQYNEQMREYEQKLGIQKVLQEISIMRDQLRLILHQKNRQIAEIKQNHQSKIHDIFTQTSQLQSQLNTNKQQCQSEYQAVLSQLQEQITNSTTLFCQHQNDLLIDDEKEHQKQEQKRREDKGLSANLQQDFKQNIQSVMIQYQQQIDEVLDGNQNILSKNRNISINVHNLHDKMGDLNIQKQKLQFDLYKVQQKQNSLEELKRQLIAENDSNKKIYDKLIKKSKELEQKLIVERKLKEKYQFTINKIKEEMTTLQETDQTIQLKYKEVSQNYITEKQFKAQKMKEIAQMEAKLQQLKIKKKEKHYANCLLKNHYQHTLKTIMRNLQINQKNTIKQMGKQFAVYSEEIEGESILLYSQYELKKKRNDKLAKDAIKWRDVKDTYMDGFYKNYNKLNQENLKLTYQYNDLSKVSQEYKTYINYLQQNIQKNEKQNDDRKKNRSVEKGLRPIQVKKKSYNSFVAPVTSNQTGKQSKLLKTRFKKKLVCISLHQDCDKFITQA